MGTFNDVLIILMSAAYGLVLILGFIVYQNNPARPAHRFFYILSVAFVLWLVCNSLQLVTTQETAIFFNYADFAIAPWVAYGLLMFLLHVPHYRNVCNHFTLFSLTLIPIITTIAVFRDLVIHNVIYNGSITVSQYGPLYDLYSLVLLSYLCAGFSVLLYRIIKVPRAERQQLSFVLFSALTVFGTLFVVNLLFAPLIDSMVQVALNNLSLVWILILGVGIRQYLFNVRVFSYTLIKGIIIITLSIVLLSLYEVLNVQVDNLLSNNLTFRILFLVITTPLFVGFYLYLERLIAVFFQNNKSLIKHLNEDLYTIHQSSITRPRDITSIVDETMYQLLGNYPTWVFKHNKKWAVYKQNEPHKYDRSVLDDLGAVMTHHDEPLVADVLQKESMPGSKKSQIAELMNVHNVSVMYPLYQPAATGSARTLYGFLLIDSDSPFIGDKELSYITMMIPQVNEILYSANLNQYSTID